MNAGPVVHRSVITMCTHSGRKKRKPQYRGGFVLEPVIGFYDKYDVSPLQAVYLRVVE